MALLPSGSHVSSATPDWWRHHNARGPLLCLAVLLAADLLLISGDVLQRNNIVHDPRFLVTRERGFGEVFQYLKLATIGCTLVLWASRLRSTAALLFALVFGYLLADDAFAVHERAGEVLSAVVPAIGPLRAAHVGELMYLLFLGGSLAVMIAYLAWHADDQERRVVIVLSACVALLALPGVGLDVLHSIVHEQRLRTVLAVVEDGAEMLAASFVVFLSVALMPVPHAARASLRTHGQSVRSDARRA